ncbi:glycoside hydrolase family 9 protein [Gorillibacterium massiliense]|uniref:glycoside hydrolase family 9 protein n=1 Tax=Gorillibacterium massiliense TaxID=1280390 RepID=UPI0004B77888|nr:glycoside hydrolase family 9 protein [Gorillibacterium massiliense]
MRKKKMSLLLALTMVFSTVISFPLSANAATPTPEAPAGWRNLVDYQIFSNTAGGWAGDSGFGLDLVNSFLPVDSTVTLNGLPSLKLDAKSPTSPSWFNALVTVAGWKAYDFTSYYTNGYLEFNIKGKVGGESFLIGFKDRVFERAAGGEITTTVNIKSYTTVTTNWTHVKIPLKEIMQVSQGIDPTSIDCLSLKNDGSTPITVWFNDIRVTSPDKEKDYAPIKVNQAGYPANAEKQALVTGFEDVLTVDENTSFNVINSTTSATAFSGKLALKKNYDAVDSGERIFTADFTSLTTPGTYYIAVSGLQNSPKFTIGDAKDIYGALLADSARYYYYQRTGINITSPYTTSYQRSDFTPDTSVPLMSTPSVKKDVSKGWYDAGDKGKYVNAGAKALSDLFWAYELLPEKFTDSQFNIPESGNGIPDILDEARWELEWMLKMQDSASGGFYARVTFQDDDNMTNRMIMDADSDGSRTNIKTTADTATAAAALAHAYLIYQSIDPTFAQTCLTAAVKAWSYLEAHPENIRTPNTGRWPYDVPDDTTNRLWAAGSLYRATGDAKYNTYFLANYTKTGTYFDDATGLGSGWDLTWNTGFFSYLKAANPDSTVVSWYTTKFQSWFNNKVTRYNGSPWKSIVSEGNYFWGINMQVTDVPMEMIIGSKLLGTYESNKSVLNTITNSQLNWILGENPVGKSFVTGYGDNSVKYPFSIMYRTDNLPGVPKGYLVGGPNKDSNDIAVGNQISRFAAKNYTDNFQEWTTNEHTIYWNSGLVFVAAFATGTTTQPPDTVAPTAPTNLTATGHTSQTVTLQWGASTDNVGVNGYNIYNGTALAGSTSGTTFTVTGLTAATSYTFTVKAKDAAGNFSTASNAVTVTTDTIAVPAAPTGVTATAGNAQATLAWSTVSGATSYTVQRSTTSGGPYTAVATGLTSTSYTNTGLTNGTTYYYVVNAVNTAGTSANSAQVSVTPQVTVPGTLVAQYRVSNTNATDNTIGAVLNIKNTGTSAVALSSLKLRYYFTKDTNSQPNFWCDWAQIGNANITSSFVTMGTAQTTADTYLELSFTSGAGSIAPGGQTGDIQLRIAKSDWSNFNEANDYSYGGTTTTLTDWNKITLYQNGTLVWGIEP